jgi:hypothetical protein
MVMVLEDEDSSFTKICLEPAVNKRYKDIDGHKNGRKP